MQCVLIGLPDRRLGQFLRCQSEETLCAPSGKVHGETTAHQGMIRVDTGTPIRAGIQNGTAPSVTYGYVVNLGPSLASYRWTPSGTSAPTVSKSSASKKQL
ncbi:unnamed protein product, partial [Dicrocoelium dendriticum]